MSPTLLVLVGPPASGKTTVSDMLKQAGWVCAAVGRSRSAADWSRLVSECRAALLEGRNVVVDHYNATHQERAFWLDTALSTCGPSVRLIALQLLLEPAECQRRMRAQKGMYASVRAAAEQAMLSFLTSYAPPEGFHEVFTVVSSPQLQEQLQYIMSLTPNHNSSFNNNHPTTEAPTTDHGTGQQPAQPPLQHAQQVGMSQPHNTLHSVSAGQPQQQQQHHQQQQQQQQQHIDPAASQPQQHSLQESAGHEQRQQFFGQVQQQQQPWHHHTQPCDNGQHFNHAAATTSSLVVLHPMFDQQSAMHGRPWSEQPWTPKHQQGLLQQQYSSQIQHNTVADNADNILAAAGGVNALAAMAGGGALGTLDEPSPKRWKRDFPPKHSTVAQAQATAVAMFADASSTRKYDEPADGAAPDVRPILLFDLNGTLTSQSVTRRSAGANRARPGTAALLRLCDTCRLGVYTSATARTAAASVAMLETAAGGTLFERGLVLHRDHTAPIPADRRPPDGDPWDTMKPLARWFSRPSRVLLIDDDAYKAAEGEEGNMVLVPGWSGDEDDQEQCKVLGALVDAVLQVLGPLGTDDDLRLHSARLQSLAVEAVCAMAPQDAGSTVVQGGVQVTSDAAEIQL